MVSPSIGRIVHFVQNGVHYPAIVVKIWSDICVNVKVFRNGSDVIVPGAVDNDDIAHSVTYSFCPTCSHVGEWSWHWPEIAQ